MGQYWIIVNLDARMASGGMPLRPIRTSEEHLDWIAEMARKQCEIVGDATVKGSKVWCLALLLRSLWQDSRVAMIGDYAENIPFLTESDRRWAAKDSYYQAAADRMRSASPLLGYPSEALGKPEYCTSDTIVLVCTTLRQYVDPRVAFGQDGTFGALIRTRDSCLAALAQQISWSNGEGGGDLEPSCGSWAGERVGIWKSGQLNLDEYEEVSPRFVRDLIAAEVMPAPTTPPAADLDTDKGAAAGGGEQKSPTTTVARA